MDWLILISLIVFGALLIMLEVIFVPGTTIVGILGLVFTALGIYHAFSNFSVTIAYGVLFASGIINTGFIIYGFKSGVWDRFALKNTVEGRTYDDRLLGLEVGQQGETISDCKPYGKIMIGDKIYEAKSQGGFISSKTNITITKIENNKIIIKP
ncbi:NfeD family protein [uncultured Cyclobacterium sp.]|uniref:NfeD family protein n=1 Tax=uncultured Cyclobacterium sp. TaxID=453820 RepID=UPI0030EF2E38|tara:strand:- start:358 stop:819 length:462 start_codon:yes stop_codon:yes gene_type:complete